MLQPFKAVDIIRVDSGVKAVASAHFARWPEGRLCSGLDDVLTSPCHVSMSSQGRMKYVRPLYRDLSKWPEKREIAISIFKEWRDNYHPIAAKMLAVDLGL